MSFTAATQILSRVPSPPAVVPTIGLLAALDADHLIDDSGIVSETGFDGSVDSWENRWQGGYAYLPEQVCRSQEAQDPCGPGYLDVNANPAVVEEMPFMVWAGDTCSSFGWEDHDFEGRATRALLATESAQIAREFWTGTQAQASGWPNRYLAETATVDTIPGGPYPPNVALSLLEAAIGDTSNGQPGMIHCTRQLGSAFSELGNTFRAVNGLMVTYLNTVIVADAGYPGTGPGGGTVAGSTQWAYATLVPTVRRSRIDVVPGSLAEALDRSTNTISWRAERLAGITIPPCTVAAIQVSLPVPVIGS